MILLAMRLGLRGSDIKSSKFHDIDWDKETIIGASHYKRTCRTPLLKNVGIALIDYLRNSRPISDQPYIFLTLRAPYNPLSNVTVSVFGATKSKVQIVEGKRAESKLLSIGNWVKDLILLFELGYFGFKNFAQIMNHGGYFISRLKSNSNPYILRSLKLHRGQTISVDGAGFQRLNIN